MNIDIDLMLTIAAGVLLAFFIKHVALVATNFLMGPKTQSGSKSKAAPKPDSSVVS